MKTVLRLCLSILLLVAILAASVPALSANLPPSASASALGIAVGAHIRPSTTYGATIANFNSTVGKNAAVIMYFTDWKGVSATQAFNPYLVDLIHKQFGSSSPAIMLTWEPINGKAANGCGKDYSGMIPYADILAGKCDAYIRNYARDLSGRPSNERYLIRFAHEMNLSDSKWWPGHFGLKADAYVKLYQHVHDVFMDEQRKAGKVNAEWVWSPNYFSNPVDSWNLYYNYYPGDAYVDWIGLSGYNWGPQSSHTFKELYGDLDGTDVYYQSIISGVLYDMACRYAKPQILAEIGAAPDTAHPKPDWITDAYSRIPAYPFLRAVVWFNDRAYASSTGTDFRVTDLTGGAISGITESYKAAISPSLYKSTLPSVQAATPPMTYCYGQQTEPVVEISPKTIMMQIGTSRDIDLTAMLFTSSPSVSFVPPAGVNISAQVTVDGMAAPWGKDRIRVTVGSNVPLGKYNLKILVDDSSVTLPVTVVNKIYNSYLPDLLR